MVYNLTPWLCMIRPFLFITLLIPKPSIPSQSIDVYLLLLVDDMKLLWEDGVHAWDALRQNFQMWVVLPWTIGDFIVYGMLPAWSTHGKLLCPHCMGHAKSNWLQCSRKATCFDCHHQYLLLCHQFRKRNRFLVSWVKKDGPSPKLSGAEIKAQIHCLPQNNYVLFLKGK